MRQVLGNENLSSGAAGGVGRVGQAGMGGGAGRVGSAGDAVSAGPVGLEGLDGLLFYRDFLLSPLWRAYHRVWRLLADEAAPAGELRRAYSGLTRLMLEQMDQLPWAWPGEGWQALTLVAILNQESLFSLWAETGKIRLPAILARGAGQSGDGQGDAPMEGSAEGQFEAPTDALTEALTKVSAEAPAEALTKVPAGAPTDALTARMLDLAAHDLALWAPVAQWRRETLVGAVAARLGEDPGGLPDWDAPGLAAGKPAPPAEREAAWRYFLSGQPWEKGGRLLLEYHRRNGAGKLGRFFAFRWDRMAAGEAPATDLMPAVGPEPFVGAESFAGAEPFAAAATGGRRWENDGLIPVRHRD
ncbi:MAG: hypothetical protein LBK98_08190, partial [Peptococcaceae bacterium]|nr:hypothetical protein [Peptococcaceae bacterium]